VHSFGSEDRKPPANEAGESPFVKASTEVFEFIVFRGADIHDLHVISESEAQESKGLHDEFASTTKPQAVIEAEKAAAAAKAAKKKGGGGGGFYDSNAISTKTEHGAPSNEDITAEEFDFQASNQGFKKLSKKDVEGDDEEEVRQAFKQTCDDASTHIFRLVCKHTHAYTHAYTHFHFFNQVDDEAAEETYNPGSSFFDSLSTNKSMHERQQRQPRSQMGKTDAQTFGAEAEHYQSKHGRGRRGGGRGGHQGGGGGRNYDNYGNNNRQNYGYKNNNNNNDNNNNNNNNNRYRNNDNDGSGGGGGGGGGGGSSFYDQPGGRSGHSGGSGDGGGWRSAAKKSNYMS
jgi:hypothetical protein